MKNDNDLYHGRMVRLYHGSTKVFEKLELHMIFPLVHFRSFSSVRRIHHVVEPKIV